LTLDGNLETPGVFSGVSASGLDLSYANLSGGNLRDGEGAADLSGTDFSGARMVGANLRAARLRGANLAGADLRRADLRDADLSHADLSDADLRHADVRNADLTEAILTRTVVASADLRGARLPADLSGTAAPAQLTYPYRPAPQGDVKRFVRHGLLRVSPSSAESRLVQLAAVTARRLFALPESAKKDCWSGPVRNHDPGWSIKPDAPHIERWHVSAAEPALNWPLSLRGELGRMSDLAAYACGVTLPLVDAVATRLSLTGGNELATDITNGSITIRLLHYTGAGTGERFPEHEDSGVATLHVYEDPPGLEVRAPGGWQDANVRSAFVLGAGRALGRRSVVRPLSHRVRSGQGPRIAVAVFFHASTGVLRTD
jgi:isopenicillin N synthase-like dioxygenase